MKAVLSKKTEFINFECKLSDDRLKLFIDLVPNFTADNIPSSDKLEEIKRLVSDDLASLVDVQTIDSDVLNSALAEALQGQKIEQRRVVKGLAPGPARDGKIVFLVKKLGGNSQIAVDDKGHADFKQLHLFDNIEVDQAVARIYPPQTGTDGKDALGQSIAGIVGKPAVFSIDKTLQHKEAQSEHNYSTLHACVAGLLFQNAEQLSILEQLRIKADVDYSTGNVDFIGSVLVDGNICSGFKVKAVQDIEVKGSCESASLESTQGKVTIKGAVNGSPETLIKAAKDVDLHIAQNQRIIAGGNIIVTKECRSCFLEAQSFITMPQAVLLAGQANVVCGLEAAEIGNESGVQTKVSISSSLEMGPEFRKLTDSRDAHLKAVALVKLHLGPLANNTSRIQFLKPELRAKMQALADKLKALTTSLNKIEADLKQLTTTGKRSQVVRVNYLKTMHAGATIIAGEHEFNLKESINGPGTVEFNLSDMQFKVLALQPLECSFEVPVNANKQGSKLDEQN